MPSEQAQLMGESMEGFMALNKKMFFFQGLWPVDSEPHNKMYYWRLFYPRFSFCCLSTALVYHQLYDLYLIRDNSLFVCKQVSILSLTVLALIGIWQGITYKDEYKRLVLFLQDLNQPGRLTVDLQREISRKAHLICDILTVVIPILLNLAIVSIIALYFLMVYLDLYPPRLLFVRGYYPWNVTSSPQYELTLFYQASTITLILNWTTPYDVTVSVVFIQTIAQFRILRHNIENLREHAVRNCLLKRNGSGRQGKEGRSSTLEREQNKEHVHTAFENNDNDVIDEIITGMNKGSFISLYKNSPYDVDGEEDGGPIVDNETEKNRFHEEKEEKTIDEDDDVRLEMRRLLEEFMEHYKQCGSAAKRLSRIFGVRLTYLIGWDVFGLIVLALYARLTPGLDVKQLACLLIGFIGVIESLFFCALSTELTHQSSLIGQALYSCDWLDASVDFKRSMRIFMTAVNQPVVIKVASYLPLSLETFLTVMNNTYSYYMVMSDLTA